MTDFLYASLWMFLLTVIESVGLTVLRLKQWWSPFITAPIYAFAVVPLLIKALDYQGIGIVNFVWNVFSTVIMFIVGIYYFKERINNIQQIGVLISLLGLFLVSLDS